MSLVYSSNLKNNSNTNNSNIVYIFITFIILIGLITYYYSNVFSNVSRNESFTEPTKTLNNALPSNTSKSNISITDLPNTSINQSANYNIPILDELLNKYQYISPDIIINDDGIICSNWDTYKENKFAKESNTCQIDTDSNSNTNKNEYQCLVDKTLTSCNSYYDDGIIETNRVVNIKQLKDNALQNIINNGNVLIKDITNKQLSVNNIMTNLTEKLNLENQQLYFIKYNTKNLDDKTFIINKAEDDFEKNENDINVNKINFSRFLDENKKNENSESLYYKIIIGLIITLIVFGIMNLLFSNM